MLLTWNCFAARYCGSRMKKAAKPKTAFLENPEIGQGRQLAPLILSFVLGGLYD
jgi:hypothetical protein